MDNQENNKGQSENSVDEILSKMGLDIPIFTQSGFNKAEEVEPEDDEVIERITDDEPKAEEKKPETPASKTSDGYSAANLFNPDNLDDEDHSEIETAYRDVKETIDIQYRMLLMDRIKEAGLTDNFTSGFAQVTHEQFNLMSETVEAEDIEDYLYANRDAFYAAVDTDDELTNLRMTLNADLNNEAMVQERRVNDFVQKMAREEASAGRPENADKIINRFESMGKRGVYDKMAISAKFEETFPSNSEHNHKNFLDTIKDNLKNTLLSDNPKVRIGMKTAMLAASCAASAGFPPLAIVSVAGIAKEVLKLPAAEPVREIISDTSKKVKDIVANIPMVRSFLKSRAEKSTEESATNDKEVPQQEAAAPKSRKALMLAGIATAFVAGATLFSDPSLDKVVELGSSLKDLGEQALGMASDAANTVGEHTVDVANHVSTQATEIANTVGDQTNDFINSSQEALKEWSRDGLKYVADTAQSLSEQANEMADSLSSPNDTLSDGVTASDPATPEVAVESAVSGEIIAPDQVAIDIPKGSSLWALSEQLLGEGATNAEIVTKINEIAELNGIEDPNVIIAGQSLNLPIADLQELERVQGLQSAMTDGVSETITGKEPDLSAVAETGPEPRDIYDAVGSEPPKIPTEADWAAIQKGVDVWSHDAAEQYTAIFESKFGQLPPDVHMQLYTNLQTTFADIDDIAKSTVGADGILHESKVMEAVSAEMPNRAAAAFHSAMEAIGVTPAHPEMSDAYHAAMEAHGGSIAGKGTIDLGNGIQVSESMNLGVDDLLDENTHANMPDRDEATGINLNNLNSVMDKADVVERVRDNDPSFDF